MSDQQRDPRGSEHAIAAALLVACLGGAGFAAVYVLGGQTQLEGVTLGVAFAGLAAGLALWAKRLVPSGRHVEEHEGFSSGEADQYAVTSRITGLARPRRRGLVGLLGLAIGTIALAALFPLRSLMRLRGTNPSQALATSSWRPGLRLVTPEGEPVRAEDISSDTMRIVYPEGHPKAADSPAFLVRLDPARVPPESARPGQLDGVVAHSLLCTHAGCAVSLYEQTTGQVLCPCHQSVFDLLHGGKPVAGPAGRALPSLPVRVGADGYLYATGDFTSPPGPGYWSRP
ncbi:ubiquinol-cytochrome c reductase iron-sulfur subunit [Amycolatopsis thermoflava]|uniref:ubiquinol-cytochrome c reductase iron-sulfur subunit n=1 Tax=Amycolatopsis thermoflava TaxID=84480 RepID=UPI003EB9BBD7